MVFALYYLYTSCGHIRQKPVFELDLLTDGSDKTVYKLLPGKCWNCVDQETCQHRIYELVGPKTVTVINKWSCGHSTSKFVPEIESSGNRNFPGQSAPRATKCPPCMQKEDGEKTCQKGELAASPSTVRYGACGHTTIVGYSAGEQTGEPNMHCPSLCPICYRLKKSRVAK